MSRQAFLPLLPPHLQFSHPLSEHILDGVQNRHTPQYIMYLHVFCKYLSVFLFIGDTQSSSVTFTSSHHHLLQYQSTLIFIIELVNIQLLKLYWLEPTFLCPPMKWILTTVSAGNGRVPHHQLSRTLLLIIAFPCVRWLVVCHQLSRTLPPIGAWLATNCRVPGSYAQRCFCLKHPLRIE